ncbi:flippase-like domain-containing protein [Haloechinothrix sp. YIM 98757]|uniref:Flippase-like domain-containing protein n=1 Tax=Haloechinothrix aidingensis TaxID=2752311 RepID=A0A838A7Q9_9PSEU|nr:lysylphosphatidylglycerol synthase domain-containing protein [Haloechinothrix aidingensis]MBA0124349.1 flippase-like domain-containing protein [Haloechinothrix aidingensis]
MAVGLLVLVLAIGYLVRGLGDTDPVGQVAELVRAMLTDPAGPVLAVGCYALAFALRSWAWCAVLPGLRFGHSWAALHVSLLGNHVLPLRLGEVLRVTSVLRRTELPRGPVLASAVTLRSGDLAAIVVLAMLAAPALVPRLIGGWGWLLAAAGLCVAGGGVAWSWRLVRRGAALRLPSPHVILAVVAAWGLESVVIWEVARIAGFPLSASEALAVTSVTIVVQTVAVTPGGFGSYEAAATAVLGAIGVPAAAAFGTALVTHAVKTVYALAVGAVALFVPAPSYWGWLRLPRGLPDRPVREPVADDAPVVAFLPVHDEAASIGRVLARLPERVAGRPLTVVVVDDGSADDSAERAAGAGATVVAHPVNRGLGAAVRTGLAEAVAQRPAAVVYLDADGEYFPEDIDSVAGPVLAGAADYVVGSRFAGEIRRMLPHRRLGNRVLTVWVRWLTRRRDLTDGQSGYRAFSPEAAAAAEVVHDYNYAQVLTLDLLAKGFAYAEVPIRYTFRDTGTSFVKLGRYLRRVIPAVHRELNADRPRGGLLRDQRPAAR